MKHKLALFITIFFLAGHATANDDEAFDAGHIATAQQLMALGLKDNRAYKLVESLTTEVGPRQAGSEAEERARQWAVRQLRDLGFENIRIEPFAVPVWQNEIEQAEIVAPFPQPLVIAALGGSVSTGEAGVEGEVIRYNTLAELESATEGSLKDKIVFIDQSMTRTQDGSGYGAAVAKRNKAAFAAHKTGALGVLIRSVGTSSHRFAHTGQMRIADLDPVPSVPAAALAAPDADQLSRALQTTNQVRVKLLLRNTTEPDGISGNVIGEIPGHGKNKDDIILLGAHLDSWNLGTGAVDDGAGVGIVVAAAKLISEHGGKSARTIRVVLFGSEENGLIGAKAYAKQHADQINNHIIGVESDFGADRIWRLDSNVADDQLPAIKAIQQVIAPLGISSGSNNTTRGPDLKYLREAGMPIVALVQSGWDYFDLHHTANDTFDKIDPQALAQNVAAYAAFTYLVANTSERFEYPIASQ